MDIKKKALVGTSIGLVITIVITILIFQFLLTDPNDELNSGSQEGTQTAGDLNSSEMNNAEQKNDDSLASEKSEDEEKEEAEEKKLEPSLKGRIFGDEGGIAGAHVLLFSTKEVERLIRSFERFDPGSGIPDIGKIVKEVKQELIKFKNKAIETQSIEDGVYEFYNLEESPYFVLTLAKNYIFKYGDVVSVEKGRTAELDMKMSPGASIGGRVVSPTGNGVPGVTVTAEYRPPGMASIGKLVQKVLKYVNGEFLKGPFQTVSGPDGRFVIDSLPHGVYDLHANVKGFPDSRAYGVTTGTLEAVVLLQEGVRIEGVLIDQSGVEIAGTVVKLSPQADAINLPIPLPGVNDMIKTAAKFLEDPDILTLSGSEGKFVFSNIASGPYLLEVSYPGFLPYSKRLTVNAGENIDLGAVAINRGSSITGQVLDTEGNPIQGAEVQAFPEGLSFQTMGKALQDFTSGRVKTQSDAEGMFSIHGLSQGKYRVIAQAHKFGGKVKSRVPTDEEPIELVLEPGITVEGKVIDDETEEPIKKAKVRASGIIGYTNNEGLFVLEGVAPRDRESMNPFGDMRPGGGPVRVQGRIGDDESEENSKEKDPSLRTISVWANFTGYQDERERFTIKEIQESEEGVVVRLKKKQKLYGIALNPDGEPLPGCLLRLVPPGLDNVPFIPEGVIFLDASVSKLDGTFVLDFPIDRGSFKVMTTHPLYASTTSERVDPRDHDKENPFEVRTSDGARIRGIVTDGKNVIPNAKVRLGKAREQSFQEKMIMGMLGLPKGGSETYTTPEGTFDYGKVLPGDYTLSAEIAGFADTWTENFTLQVGDDKEVEITLNPGGPIQGIVYDQDGQPLSGARIRILKNETLNEEMLQAQRFLGGAFKMTTSNSDGQFKVQGLPQDAYSIVVEKKGYTKAEDSDLYPDEEDQIEVTLFKAAQIMGFVTNAATNQPIIEFSVRVKALSGADSENDDGPMQFLRAWRPVRNSMGQFFRENLAEGLYSIEVKAEGYAKASTQLQLKSGSEVELPFSLVQAGKLQGLVVDSQTNLPIKDARITIGPPLLQADAEEDKDVIKKREEDLLADPQQVMNDYFERRFTSDQAKTDAEGRFELGQFDGEPHSVTVTHEEYIQERQPNMTIQLGSVQEQTFVMRKGLEVSGTITDVDGTPAERAYVVARGVDTHTKHIEKGYRVRSNGKYHLKGLPPGRYVLVTQSRGTQPSARTVDIEGSNVVEIDIPLGETK